MKYSCTSCEWEGDNPDESSDGEGMPVCPLCGYLCDSDDADYGDSKEDE